jgi:hypothetical protein
MFKICLKFVCCIMISVFLVSCSSLKSEHYVGELSPAADEKVKDTSVWEFDDTIFFVNIVDSSTLIASTMKWNKAKKEHEIIKSKVILTELKGPNAYFLNFKEGSEDLYTILLLAPTKNEKDYLVYTVNEDTIKKHINEGKVKAIKKGGDYILKLSKEELDKYVRENFYTLFSLGGAGIIKAMDCKNIFK